MKSLKQYIMESKTKAINTTVKDYLEFYFDKKLDEINPDDFKDCDMYWDLLDNGTFDNYNEMVEYLKEHAGDVIELKEMQVSNPDMMDHVFYLKKGTNQVEFYAQSINSFE